MVVDHPIDLLPLFVTVVVREFIDNKQKNDKGNCQRDREPKGIDNCVKLISPQKSKSGFDVVFEHASWGASECVL